MMNFQANIYLSVIHLQAVGLHLALHSPPAFFYWFAWVRWKRQNWETFVHQISGQPFPMALYRLQHHGRSDQMQWNQMHDCHGIEQKSSSPILRMVLQAGIQTLQHSVFSCQLADPSQWDTWSMLLQASERLRIVKLNSTAFLLIFLNGGQPICWSCFPLPPIRVVPNSHRNGSYGPIACLLW